MASWGVIEGLYACLPAGDDCEKEECKSKDSHYAREDECSYYTSGRLASLAFGWGVTRIDSFSGLV